MKKNHTLCNLIKTMKLILVFVLPCLFFISSCTKDNVTTNPEIPIDPGVYTIIDFAASWSPDGKQIVYLGDANLPATRDLYIVDTSGNNKRLLTHLNGNNPDWSPDGQWIVFEYDEQIYKKGIGTDTSLIQLTAVGENHFPSWSYDGQWIAYDARTDETFSYVWKMRSDGTNKKRVIYTPTSGEVQSPDWFPDGIRLAVSRYIPNHGGGSEISIIDTSGNILIEITNDRISDSRPKVSISNDILYIHEEFLGQVMSVKPDGTEFKLLTGSQSDYACWSPDGNKIAYTNTNGDGRIWMMKKDGTGKRKLTH